MYTVLISLFFKSAKKCHPILYYIVGSQVCVSFVWLSGVTMFGRGLESGAGDRKLAAESWLSPRVKCPSAEFGTKLRPPRPSLPPPQDVESGS